MLPPLLLELLRLLGVHLYHDVPTLTRLLRVLAAVVRNRPAGDAEAAQV